MELKVNATIHLKPEDVQSIIREYIEKQTGKPVGKIDIKVHSGSDDRYHYIPPGLTGIDVEVKI